MCRLICTLDISIQANKILGHNSFGTKIFHIIYIILIDNHRLEFLKKCIFESFTIVFILTNSADPD